MTSADIPLAMNAAAQEQRPAGVRIRRAGNVGRITLDRPAKINALSREMVEAMGAALAAWAVDDTVKSVILDGAGARGLCAGGDIRTLHEEVRANIEEAFTFWAQQYQLDAQIAGFPKPVVALMPGIVMGGGVGLSAHTRHRIVTETTRLAMPEVGIGLIPDVGATWLLSRAPGQFGTYIALTAQAMGAAEAIANGFADAVVAEHDLDALVQTLIDCGPTTGSEIDAVVATFAYEPGELPLEPYRSLIDEAFAFDTVEQIVAALSANRSSFAQQTAQNVLRHSPTSVKVTLRALREARRLPALGDCLRLEYRVVRHLLEMPDFFEGVRAVVIEKDQRPRWNPSSLLAVSDERVAACFVSLGAGELRLS